MKKGIRIVINGQPYEIIESAPMFKGRGHSVLQAKIKNLKTGNILSYTFQPSDRFEEPELEKISLKYLYSHRNKFVFSRKEDPSQRFELNQEQIKEIMPELLSIGSEDASKRLGASNMEELKQNIDKFFEKIKGMDAELWIGKKDFLLYRVKIDKEIEASVLDKKANGKLIINFDLVLSKTNEPMKIEAPEKFLDLKEILASVWGNYLRATSEMSSSEKPH